MYIDSECMFSNIFSNAKNHKHVCVCVMYVFIHILDIHFYSVLCHTYSHKYTDANTDSPMSCIFTITCVELSCFPSMCVGKFMKDFYNFHSTLIPLNNKSSIFHLSKTSKFHFEIQFTLIDINEWLKR